MEPSIPDVGGGRFRLYAPFLWLIRYILERVGGHKGVSRPVTPVPYLPFQEMNGAQRRYLKKIIRKEKDIIAMQQRILVRRVFSRALSRTQYLERTARLFHGRVRVYRFRHRGARRQRQAQLACFDHGTWRAPDSAALCGGLWDAQLPPD